MRWRLVCALVASLFVLGAACGGRSFRHDEGDAGDGTLGPDGTGGVDVGNGGSTGGNGVGGVGTGATLNLHGGSGGHHPDPPRYCEFEGAVFAAGDKVEDPLICRTCVCAADGDMDCSHCDKTCVIASRTLSAGESLLQSDGCTVCLCTVNGVDCSSESCAAPDPCKDLVLEYEFAVGALRGCGPQYDNYTCKDAVAVRDSIPCGCLVPTRESATYRDIATRYYESGCAPPEFCERMCGELNYNFTCGVSGFCVGGP